MKTLLLNYLVLSLVAFSLATHADTTVSAQDTMDIEVLRSVTDAKFTEVSKANGASAKLFQMLYGDGGVNTSTAFLIIEGSGGSKGYPVAKSISGIKRITFSGMGEITVNYTRSKPVSETENVEENHSLKVKFTKKADGSLADTVEIKD